MVKKDIIFVSIVLGSVLSLFSAITFIYLLIRYVIIKSSRSLELQDTIKVYIFTEILNAFVAGFYLTYSCILYYIDNAEAYTSPLLFWSVFSQNITSLLRFIAIITLGIDRIFIIIMPTIAESKRKCYSFIIGIILVIISTTLLLVLRIIQNISRGRIILVCMSLLCLANLDNAFFFIILRMIFGFTNFLQGVGLLIILKKKLKAMYILKNKNKNIVLVIFTLLINITFNFVPNLFGFIFGTVSYSTSGIIL